MLEKEWCNYWQYKEYEDENFCCNGNLGVNLRTTHHFGIPEITEYSMQEFSFLLLRRISFQSSSLRVPMP